MTRDEWQRLVDQARTVDMLDVARQHGVELRKQGQEFVGACPVCGTGNDRFAIQPKRKVFNCRVCGKGGRGSVDLEIFCSGVDYVEAVKQLTGATSLSSHRSPAAEAAAQAEADKRKAEQQQDEAAQHRKAAWLWLRRQPAIGSLVETYLRARGYSGTIPPTLGFLPPRGEHGPAMIAAYAGPNEIEPGELGALDPTTAAIHLTRLLPDGSDRLRTKGAKITIGRPLGMPIAVSSITDGLSLCICEGIEDALALAAAGYAAWASGNASFMPALADSVPDYITTVILEQHPDESGRRYSARLAELLRAREPRKGERLLEVLIRDATS
jgi:hypothetical protein